MQRSTIIALIVLGLLGGLYWYSKQEEQPIPLNLGGTPTPTQEAPGYLVEPYSKTVSRLNIQLAEGQELSLSFAGQAWVVRDANVELTPVDSDAAESIVANIQSLRILSKIETFSSLDDFGLGAETPTARIEVDFSDKSILRIRIGKATPTGSGYYAIDLDQPGTILVLSKLSLDRLLDAPVNPPIFVPPDTLESTPQP